MFLLPGFRDHPSGQQPARRPPRSAPRRRPLLPGRRREAAAPGALPPRPLCGAPWRRRARPAGSGAAAPRPGPAAAGGGGGGGRRSPGRAPLGSAAGARVASVAREQKSASPRARARDVEVWDVTGRGAAGPRSAPPVPRLPGRSCSGRGGPLTHERGGRGFPCYPAGRDGAGREFPRRGPDRGGAGAKARGTARRTRSRRGPSAAPVPFPPRGLRRPSGAARPARPSRRPSGTPRAPGRGSHARLPPAVTSPPRSRLAASVGGGGSPRAAAWPGAPLRSAPLHGRRPAAFAAVWRAAWRRLPPSLSAALLPALRCPMFGLEEPAGRQKPGRSGGFPNMASVGDFNVLGASIPATKVELSVSCRYGGGRGPPCPRVPGASEGAGGRAGRPPPRGLPAEGGGREKGQRPGGGAARCTPGAVRGAFPPALGERCPAPGSCERSAGGSARAQPEAGGRPAAARLGVPGAGVLPADPRGRSAGSRRGCGRQPALPKRAAAAAAPDPSRKLAGGERGSRGRACAQSRFSSRCFNLWSCPQRRGWGRRKLPSGIILSSVV